MSNILELADSSRKKQDGIPTTTYEKEMGKNKVKYVFRAKLFMITDDESASVYAEFINDLIDSKSEMLNESSTWTQHGEFTKFIEYKEPIDYLFV